jgi:hypothetical protein
MQREDVRQVVGPMDGPQNATEIIRSMALSSAELWHDVLQRLSEMQEGQLLIAQAIADLGAVVQELSTSVAPLLGPSPQLALAAGGSAPSSFCSSSAEAPALPAGATETVTGADADDAETSIAASRDVTRPARRRRFHLRLRRHERADAIDELSDDLVDGDTDELELTGTVDPGAVLGIGDDHEFDIDAGVGTSILPPPPLVTPPPPVVTAAAPPPPADFALAPPSSPAAPPAFEFPPSAPVAEHPRGPEPSLVAPDAGIRLAPQALVYTPTTAETSITSEVGLLTVPAPPVPPGADSFEVPDASEAAEEAAVAGLPAVAEVPVVAEVPPVTEVPGIAQDSVLSGVGVTVQSTASLATEILATATRSGAEAPREPAPLVISEDLTLISRNRKRRLQFRVR